MASAATNLFDAELVIGITLGGGSDKAGRSAQIFSKAFPFATPALNIRIRPITIHATSANGIFLKVKEIGIRHPIQNLTYCANGCTTRTDQGSDSLTSLSGHVSTLLVGTDMIIAERLTHNLCCGSVQRDRRLCRAAPSPNHHRPGRRHRSNKPRALPSIYSHR